jgi:hypothetical protein
LCSPDVGVALRRAKVGGGAIFAGQVEAQPIIELIAEAPADDRRVADRLLVEGRRRHHHCWIIECRAQPAQLIDAHANEAAQIPAAEIDRRRRGLHHRRRRQQVGGRGGARYARDDRGRKQEG